MGALERGLQDGRAGTEFLFQAFEKYWQRNVYGLFSGREISGGIVEQAPKSWISDLEACSLSYGLKKCMAGSSKTHGATVHSFL